VDRSVTGVAGALADTLTVAEDWDSREANEAIAQDFGLEP
jgi:hypothetical protein